MAPQFVGTANGAVTANFAWEADRIDGVDSTNIAGLTSGNIFTALNTFESVTVNTTVSANRFVGTGVAPQFVGTANGAVNADKLDGYDSTEVVLAAANNIFTGTNRFEGIATFNSSVTFNSAVSFNYNQETLFQGPIRTYGQPNQLPSGWAGGVETWDIYAHGSLAMGQSGQIKSLLNNGGGAGFSSSVGIGTLNPGSQLEVIATTAAGESAVVFLRNGAADAAGNAVSMVLGTAGDSSGQAKISGVRNSEGAGKGDLAFSTFGTAMTEQMRITSSGKVGIGTLSPQSQLQVGSAIFAGTGTQNGTVTANVFVGTGIVPQFVGTANGALNADMLDGVDSTDFATSAGNNTFSGITTFTGPVLFDPTKTAVAITTANNVFRGTNAFLAPGVRQVKIGNPDETDTAQPAEVYFDRVALGNEQQAAVGMGGTARNFYIWVNNEDRLNITSAGNVGIGTPEPGAKLHITGGTDATFGSGGYLVMGATTAGNIVIDDNEIMARNNGAKSNLHLQADGGDLFIHQNQVGTEMIVKDSGFVGIGTTAPRTKLEVNSGAMSLYSGLNNASTRPAVGTGVVAGEIHGYGFGTEANDGFLRLSAGGGTGATTKSYIDLSGYSTVGDMNQNIVLGVGGAERMRITPSGFAGTGDGSATITKFSTTVDNNDTTVPTGKAILDHIGTNVASLTGANTFSALNTFSVGALGAESLPMYLRNNAVDTAGNTVGLVFGTAENSTAVGQAKISGVRNAGGAGKGDLAFSTFGTAMTEQMRITSAGNVGIGTVDPQAPLDVNGNIAMQGSNVLFRDASNTILVSPTSIPLAFKQGTAEVARFDATGKLGIGTGTPKELLQVGDQMTFHNGGSKFIGFNNTWDADQSRDEYIVNGGAAKISFDSTTGGLTIYNAASGTVGNPTAFGIGTTFTSTGVGIGKPNPSTALDVNGVVTATEYAGTSGAGSATITKFSTTVDNNDTTVPTGKAILDHIGTNVASLTGDNLFTGKNTFQSAGIKQVIIGNPNANNTAEPAELYFNRTAVANTQQAAIGMGDTNRNFYIWVNGQDRFKINSIGNINTATTGVLSNSAWVGSALLGGSEQAVAIGELTYDNQKYAVIGGHNSAATAWSDLIISPDPNGNVGVGTYTPEAKLDVNGNIAMQGSNVLFRDANNTILISSPNVSLSFKQGTTEVARFDATGKLGIGTGTPTTELDVNGTVTATTFSGNGSGLTNVQSETLRPHDLWSVNGRIPVSPSSTGPGTLFFGFGAFNNTPASPPAWADYLLMRSYTDSSGGSDNLLMFSKGSINARMYQQDFGSTSAFSTYKDFVFASGTSSGYIPLFSDYATLGNSVIKQVNNYVGIGTGDPQYFLTFPGNDTATTPYIGFPSTNPLYQSGIGTFHITNHGQQVAIYAGAASQGADGKYRLGSEDIQMIVGPTGVGIGLGNAPPSAPLHVTARASGGYPDTGGLYVYNPTAPLDVDRTQDAVISVRTNGANAGNPFISWDVVGVYGWAMGIDNSDGQKLKIGANWGSLSQTTRLTIDADGDVGIGTTSPGSKLTVAGTIESTSGGLKFPDGTTQTSAAITAQYVNDMFRGSIQAFAYTGDKTSQGWLLCDGRTVKIANYQALFNVIGGTYNSGNVPSDEFRLPDLRGQFIRGADNMGTGAAGRDSTSGRLTGTTQDDSTRAPRTTAFTTSDRYTFLGGTYIGKGNTTIAPWDNFGWAERTQSVSGGDPETSPKNIAMAYYIKY